MAGVRRQSARVTAGLAALAAVALLAVLLGFFAPGAPGGPRGTALAPPAASPSLTAAPSSSPSKPGTANPSSLPPVKESALPAEGRRTLVLIRQGGPYPFARDGVVFGNLEGLLPRRARGYYHEYTVPTPGSPDRGARRIIAGTGGDKYYTADHYVSFFFILEGQ